MRAEIAAIIAGGDVGDALGGAAVDLTVDDERVDHRPRVVDHDEPAQVDDPRVRVDLDHRDVGAEDGSDLGDEGGLAAEDLGSARGERKLLAGWLWSP